MTAKNKNNRTFRLSSVEIPSLRGRMMTMIVVGILPMLAIAWATRQFTPFGIRNMQQTSSLNAQDSNTFSEVSVDRDVNSENLRSSIESLTADREKDFVQDLLLDGLEFAVAGLEVTSTAGPFMQFGGSISQLATTFRFPEDTSMVDRVVSGNTMLIADRYNASAE